MVPISFLVDPQPPHVHLEGDSKFGRLSLSNARWASLDGTRRQLRSTAVASDQSTGSTSLVHDNAIHRDSNIAAKGSEMNEADASLQHGQGEEEISDRDRESASPGTASPTRRRSTQHTPKRTGQLTKEQRAKAKDARKKGACIRCRVLKKPCAGNTPCDECTRVSRTRVWTRPCRRDKLHEHRSIFEAPKAILSAATQPHDDSVCVQSSADVECGQLHITFGHCSSVVTTIDVRYVLNKTQDEDKSHNVHIEAQSLVDAEIKQQLRRVIKEERAQLLILEQSPVMKSTARVTMKLAEIKGDQVPCMVLDSWLCALLLLDGERSINVSLVRTESNRCEKIINVDDRSASMVRTRVRQALADNIAFKNKELLAKLETRIHMPKNLVFETYLSTLLVLNAAERLCWWVRSQQPQQAPGSTRELDSDYTAQIISDTETLAELVDTMITNRRIVPPLIADREETLTTSWTENEDVKLWLNEIDLTTGSLRSMLEGPYLEDDCTSMDGRLWARSPYGTL